MIIAKAGKPVAQLRPIDLLPVQPQRLGFLEGQASIPDDFDTWAGDAIAETFGAGS